MHRRNSWLKAQEKKVYISIPQRRYNDNHDYIYAGRRQGQGDVKKDNAYNDDSDLQVPPLLPHLMFTC